MGWYLCSSPAEDPQHYRTVQQRGGYHAESAHAGYHAESAHALLEESCSESYHGGDVDVVGVWDSEVVLTAFQMHNGILLTSLPMAGLHKIGLFLLHSFTMGPGNVEIAK